MQMEGGRVRHKAAARAARLACAEGPREGGLFSFKFTRGRPRLPPREFSEPTMCSTTLSQPANVCGSPDWQKTLNSASATWPVNGWLWLCASRRCRARRDLFCQRRKRLFGGDQHVERLPRLGHVSDAGREFTDALPRISRGEDHGKKRPAHLHLARQINAVHDAAKADVREDHR